MRGRRSGQRHDHRAPLSGERFDIGGRTVTLPVEVRRASSWAVHFLVPAERAGRMIAHTGLEVAEPLPGRALVSIPFVRYTDGDLDAYDEVGVAVAVRLHDAPPAGPAARALEVVRKSVGVYIHHLPVTEAFSLEAGRTIWGFPKILADIRIERRAGSARCTLRADGEHVLTLAVPDDGGVRMPPPSAPAYTWMDGTLRLTRWEMRGETRARLGGGTLLLGDHPIAMELRSLGLPRRAFMTDRMPHMRARFGAPQEIRRAARSHATTSPAFRSGGNTW